jgi:tetratricopeptide (TPR) repeat protein
MPPPRPELRRSIVIAAALALLAVILYARTASYPFIQYDDDRYVYQNPAVLAGLSLDNLRWAFTTTDAANWHPITWLSFMFDVQLFGPRPGAMHLENVLLHAANAILLFILLRAMTDDPWPSAFAAALFAVHPAHVESVAWISERKDMLSTLFMLLAMCVYVRYARRRTRRTLWYALLILLFALALMSKPMVVTLPACLLLIDYWPLRRMESWRDARVRLIEKIPLAAMSAAACVITYIAQSRGGAVRPLEQIDLARRLANALISCAIYLRNVIFPVGLAIPYPLPAHIPVSALAVSAVVLIALVFAAIAAARSNRRYVTVGLLWFFGTLVPVIGIVQVGEQSMADRYTYIPYIGLFLIFAWGMAELAARIGAAPAASIAAGFLFVLAVLAIRQVGVWRDTETLFAHAAKVTTDNWLAYHQLGIAYASQNRLDEAEAMYARALALRPGAAWVRYNLGNALLRQGRSDQAKQQYQLALRDQPDFAPALSNYGILLAGAGELQQAARLFEKAIDAAPDFAEAHANLGLVRLKTGDTDGAEREFRLALHLAPHLPAAVNGMEQLTRARFDGARSSPAGRTTRPSTSGS